MLTYNYIYIFTNQLKEPALVSKIYIYILKSYLKKLSKLAYFSQKYFGKHRFWTFIFVQNLKVKKTFGKNMQVLTFGQNYIKSYNNI